MTRRRLTGLRELAIFAAGYLVYFGVRALTQGDVGQALANADAVERLERLLGIDWESTLQSAVIDHATLVRIANWIYIFGHWPLLLLAGAALYHWRPRQYRLLRTACLLSGAVGLVVFVLFPVAPPRLAGAGVDTVTVYAGGYRTALPTALVNEYAAMPSFHAGWNVLLGIALFRATSRRSVRAFALAMPALMILSIVVTANHYVLDAVVGTTIVVACVLALDLRERARTRPTLGRHASVGPGPALERSHPRRAVAVRGRPPRGERPGAAHRDAGAPPPRRRG